MFAEVTVPADKMVLYCTTQLMCDRGGGVQSSGTGFFFDVRRAAKDPPKPVLVTNQHVVEGAASGSFLLRIAEAVGGKYRPTKQAARVRFEAAEVPWVRHPDGLDLCALPLAGTLAEVQKTVGPPFCPLFDTGHIPSEDVLQSMGAFEHVVMVGYPIGLFDPVNQFPLVRRGITAYQPALDWQGRPEGLVDIAAFPGSSGSPIVAWRETTRPGPNGPYELHFESKLLGILWGGPQFNAQGEVHIEAAPTSTLATSSTRIPTHLGQYIKARELLRFRDLI